MKQIFVEWLLLMLVMTAGATAGVVPIWVGVIVGYPIVGAVVGLALLLLITRLAIELVMRVA